MPSFADIDGDSDMDLFITVLGGDGPIQLNDNFLMYENIGSASNPEYSLSTENFLGALDLFSDIVPEFIDIDNDGDMDVLTNSRLFGPVGFHMFINDGSENFTMSNITLDADSAYSVYAADLDNDGDMDVLTASQGDDKIAWYENDGSATFSFHVILTKPTAQAVSILSIWILMAIWMCFPLHGMMTR